MESNKPSERAIAAVSDNITAHRATIPPSGRSSSQSGRGDNVNDGGSRPSGATNSPIMESIKSSGGPSTPNDQTTTVRSEHNPTSISHLPSERVNNSNGKSVNPSAATNSQHPASNDTNGSSTATKIGLFTTSSKLNNLSVLTTRPNDRASKTSDGTNNRNRATASTTKQTSKTG